MTKREECVACMEKRRRAAENLAHGRRRSSSAKPSTIYASPKTPSASMPALHQPRKRSSSVTSNPNESRPHFSTDTVVSAIRRRESHIHDTVSGSPQQSTPKKSGRPSILKKKIQQTQNYLLAQNIDIKREHTKFSYNDACAVTSRGGFTLHELRCSTAAQIHKEDSTATDVNEIIDNALNSRAFSEADLSFAELKHVDGCEGAYTPMSSRNSMDSYHYEMDRERAHELEHAIDVYEKDGHQKLRNLGLAAEDEPTPIPTKQPWCRTAVKSPTEWNANVTFDPESTPKAVHIKHSVTFDTEATPLAADYQRSESSELSSKENQCISVIENGTTPKKHENQHQASIGKVLGTRLNKQLDFCANADDLDSHLNHLNEMKEEVKRSVDVHMPRAVSELTLGADKVVERSPTPDYTVHDFTLQKCSETIDECVRTRKFLRDIRKELFVAQRNAAKIAGNTILVNDIFKKMKDDVNDCNLTTDRLVKNLQDLKASKSSSLDRAVFYVDRVIELSGWQLQSLEIIESAKHGAMSSVGLHEELSKLLKLVESVRWENESKRASFTTPKRDRSNTPSKSFTKDHSLMLENRIAAIGAHIRLNERESSEPSPRLSPTDSRAKDTDYDVSSLQDFEVSVGEPLHAEVVHSPMPEKFEELVESQEHSETTETDDATTQSKSNSKSETEPTESKEGGDGDGQDELPDEPSISEMDDVQTAVDSSSANLDSIWQSENGHEGNNFNLSQGGNLDTSTGMNSSVRRRTYVNSVMLAKMRNSMSPKTPQETFDTHWPSPVKKSEKIEDTSMNKSSSFDFDLSSDCWNIAAPVTVIPGLDFEQDLSVSQLNDEAFSISYTVQGQLDVVVGRLRKELPSTVEEIRPKLLEIAEKLLPYANGENKDPLTYFEKDQEKQMDTREHLVASYEALLEDLCVDVVNKLNLPGELKYSVPVTRFAQVPPKNADELVTLFEEQLKGKLSLMKNNNDVSSKMPSRGDLVYIAQEQPRPEVERFVLDVLMPHCFGDIEKELQEEYAKLDSQESELLTNTTTSSF